MSACIVKNRHYTKSLDGIPLQPCMSCVSHMGCMVSLIWYQNAGKQDVHNAHALLMQPVFPGRDSAATLILELGFNMMYLMEPWMFSVQDASQVTLLSWRTSFHFVPGGGLGCLESLQKKKQFLLWMCKMCWQLTPEVIFAKHFFNDLIISLLSNSTETALLPLIKVH